MMMYEEVIKFALMKVSNDEFYLEKLQAYMDYGDETDLEVLVEELSELFEEINEEC
jgi:hypothetical protein